MRYFTASGLWFLGDDPKNRVAGTLHYSRQGLYLKLLGVFRGGWRPQVEPYPLIQGVVSKNPFGEYVTLIDCFTERTTLNSAGLGLETVYCNRGIFGDSHLPTDYDEFEALDITISYLTDWFGHGGIISGGDVGSVFDIRYRMNEPVRFPIGDKVLSLGMAVKSGITPHKYILTEETHIGIRPLSQLTAEHLHGEYVRPLQDLLSFATDTPNAVETFTLQGEKVVHGKVAWNRRYRPIDRPIFQLKKKPDLLTPDRMLFTFDEAQTAGLNIFEEWFEFKKRYDSFCTVYFALLYAPPKYLDEKFLRLMSAFTILAGSYGEISSRTGEFLEGIGTLAGRLFNDEERALLGFAIPTGAEIEMPFSLLRLLEEHRPLMGQLIGDDFPGFVRSLSSTLAFVERRTAVDARQPLQDVALYDAMEKIRILIKIVVLKELGFGEESISKFLERNRQFVQLKGS
jgi:ApeA N-terminal domain 1